MDTAFEILAQQYRPMLLSYARALMGGHEHDAEDVVQEGQLTAHQRLESFRSGENFGRWLRGIVRNKALESHRAARGRAIVDSRIVEGVEEVYAIFDPPSLGEEPAPFTPTFRADRPFVFLIRDRKTGTVLFLGRMTSPQG